MSVPVALIQGASRGLGLQFCKHILQTKPNAVVVATCRRPDASYELLSMRQEHGERLPLFELDVTNEEQIKDVCTNVKSQYGKVDLLVNCAAMLHPSGRGETSLDAVTPNDQAIMFATNTTGPLLMAKHFKTLLMKGEGLYGRIESSQPHRSIIANISARVGSISDNGLGGWYAYRMSKCALNMATKNLSIELGRGKNKVICIVMHPGTVETDLSRPYHKGVPREKLFTPEHSVNCLMGIIEGLDVRHTGKYYAWDGQEIPY